MILQNMLDKRLYVYGTVRTAAVDLLDDHKVLAIVIG